MTNGPPSKPGPPGPSAREKKNLSCLCISEYLSDISLSVKTHHVPAAAPAAPRPDVVEQHVHEPDDDRRADQGPEPVDREPGDDPVGEVEHRQRDEEPREPERQDREREGEHEEQR